MTGNARDMYMLRKNNLRAFADLDNRDLLVLIRRYDPDTKGGRITRVLQMRPDQIREGYVYGKPGSPWQLD